MRLKAQEQLRRNIRETFVFVYNSMCEYLVLPHPQSEVVYSSKLEKLINSFLTEKELKYNGFNRKYEIYM